MERLAEDRKGPSSAEHKKRQMLGALAASLQVLHPLTCSHLAFCLYGYPLICLTMC